MTLDATQALLILLLVDAVKDGIIAWRLLGMLSNGQPKPPIVIPPPVLPPVEPPVLPPVVPPIHTGPRFNDIITTEFGGVGDEQPSAYGGQVDGNKLGYALPYHFPSSPPSIVVFANNRSVVVPAQDVGPWYPSAKGPADKYWETGTRPRAESDPRTNGAGLDLTPETWRQLGLAGVGKAKMSWDFQSVIGGGDPPVTPAPPVGDGLIKQTWPTQAECPTFYGSPSQVAASLVKVHCPWVFTVEGTQSQNITIHTKCAASLTRVLAFIWKEAGQSQAKIHEWGYDVFDGSYNPRNIAGTSKPSVHSYAAAMDWNAAANPQHAPISKCKFKPDSCIVFAFKAEGWIWGGDWTPASIDAMHFQAARVR
jgi:hypothetical protein